MWRLKGKISVAHIYFSLALKTLYGQAAALFYCKVKHKDGSFVSCECVFIVVYDVLVASTSVYRRGSRSLRKLTSDVTEAVDSLVIRTSKRSSHGATVVFVFSTRSPLPHVVLHLQQVLRGSHFRHTRTESSIIPQSVHSNFDNHVRYLWRVKHPTGAPGALAQ